MRLTLLFVVLLSSCSLLPSKTVFVPPVEIPKVPFISPPLPRPVELEPPVILVINPENAQLKFDETGEGSFFAMSTRDYTLLANNIQEFRRYIRQLQEVLVFYINYLEESENDDN